MGKCETPRCEGTTGIICKNIKAREWVEYCPVCQQELDASAPKRLWHKPDAADRLASQAKDAFDKGQYEKAEKGFLSAAKRTRGERKEFYLWCGLMARYGVFYVDDRSSGGGFVPIFMRYPMPECDSEREDMYKRELGREPYKGLVETICQIAVDIRSLLNNKERKVYSVFVAWHGEGAKTAAKRASYTLNNSSDHHSFCSAVTLKNERQSMFEPKCYVALHEAKAMIIVTDDHPAIKEKFLGKELERFSKRFKTPLMRLYRTTGSPLGDAGRWSSLDAVELDANKTEHQQGEGIAKDIMLQLAGNPKQQPAGDPVSQPAPRPKPLRTVLALLAAVCLLIGGGMLFKWWNDRNQPPQPAGKQGGVGVFAVETDRVVVTEEPTVEPTAVPTADPTATPTAEPTAEVTEFGHSSDAITIQRENNDVVITIPKQESEHELLSYILYRKDAYGNSVELHTFEADEPLVFVDTNVPAGQYVYSYAIDYLDYPTYFSGGTIVFSNATSGTTSAPHQSVTPAPTLTPTPRPTATLSMAEQIALTTAQHDSYEQAEKLLAEGRYQEASDAFAAAGDYSDAASRVKEPFYAEAEYLLSMKDYEYAAVAFEKAGDYSDAASRVNEPYYVKAEDLLAAKKYDQASALFAILAEKGYSDAAERVNEPYYVQAEDLLAAGDYDEALIIFQVLANNGYDDAGDRAVEAERLSKQKREYEKGMAYLQKGSCSEALKAFQAAGGYSDATEKTKLLYTYFGNSIATGKNHTVGLRTDGTVMAVGNNKYGQCDVDNWTDIVAVAAGDNHTIGLKSDGTVVAVGNNEYGQCDVDNWTDIAAIDAGYNYSVGYKSDGIVVARRPGIINMRDMTDLVAITDDGSHAVGLRSDGTVVAGGTLSDVLRYDDSSWTDIVAVSLGVAHSVGLKSDGTVVAGGSNDSGRCAVDDWKDVVAIAAGYSYSLGLRGDGTVVATGYNHMGQCNVVSFADVVAIASKQFHTIGLKSDGTLVATGDNSHGQCNISSWTNIGPNKTYLQTLFAQ